MMRKFLIIILCFMAGTVGILYILINTTSTSEIEKNRSSDYYIARNQWEAADNQLQNMSLDEKIGQLLFVLVPESEALEEIQKYHFGGYILFGEDLQNETIESMAAKIKTWQEQSKVKMFIGIDEEGGTVSRLTYAGFANFASPQELFAQGGLGLIKETEKKKIEIFKAMGINVNFAPVADTCIDQDAFIYSRSFGKSAEETAEFVEAVVESYNRSGVSATLKHFPGYGNNLDTHSGIAIDERELTEFRSSDFKPFEAGIKSGVDFIMFSHNIVKNIDAENPASLSKELHRIAREELGYQGIIITDDLAMDAVNKFYQGTYEKEVQAVLAGNNMLIVSDYKNAFNNIKNAVENGALSESLIEDAIWPVLFRKAKI